MRKCWRDRRFYTRDHEPEPVGEPGPGGEQ
jgi:hypothetical protein